MTSVKKTYQGLPLLYLPLYSLPLLSPLPPSVLAASPLSVLPPAFPPSALCSALLHLPPAPPPSQDQIFPKAIVSDLIFQSLDRPAPLEEAEAGAVRAELRRLGAEALRARGRCKALPQASSLLSPPSALCSALSLSSRSSFRPGRDLHNGFFLKPAAVRGHTAPPRCRRGSLGRFRVLCLSDSAWTFAGTVHAANMDCQPTQWP